MLPAPLLDQQAVGGEPIPASLYECGLRPWYGRGEPFASRDVPSLAVFFGLVRQPARRVLAQVRVPQVGGGLSGSGPGKPVRGQSATRFASARCSSSAFFSFQLNSSAAPSTSPRGLPLATASRSRGSRSLRGCCSESDQLAGRSTRSTRSALLIRSQADRRSGCSALPSPTARSSSVRSGPPPRSGRDGAVAEGYPPRAEAGTGRGHRAEHEPSLEKHRDLPRVGLQQRMQQQPALQHWVAADRFSESPGLPVIAPPTSRSSRLSESSARRSSAASRSPSMPRGR